MHRRNALFAFLSLALFAIIAPPAHAGHMTLRAGTPVTVESYEAKYDLFSLKLNEEPEQGPNLARPRNLQKALGMKVSLDAFMRKKSQILGSVYNLQTPLLLEEIPVEDNVPLPPPEKKSKKAKRPLKK